MSSNDGVFENTVVGFTTRRKTNMKLARGMKTAFAVARSNSVATQVEAQESTKRKSMRIVNGTLTLIIAGLLIAPIASPKARGGSKACAWPDRGKRDGSGRGTHTSVAG